MLNNILRQEHGFVASLIDMYKDEITKTEKAISEVEEKYKKLAEEEAKNLNIELIGLRNQLMKWQDFSDADRTTVEEYIKERFSAPEAKKDEEPKIEDTLYPENNESPCNSSDEPTEEERQEEEVSDEPTASEPVELDEHPEVMEEWEEETEAEANEDDDDWGEPKDWN